MNQPVAILALTMVLVPALGVPSVLLLQDTLKSALVVFGVLSAASLFFWQQRKRTAPLLWHGVVVLPLALMAYASVSMAWSHTYLAASETVRWFVLALLLFLGLNTLTRENFPTLARGIHFGAFIASVWIALQFWFDLRLFPQFAVPASTFINRNFFAEYAVCALPFSVFVLATMGASRWRVLTAAALALNLVAIMMTGTRSALIALAVLAVVLPLMLARHRQQFACFGWRAHHRAVVALVLLAGVLGMGTVPTSNPRVLQQDSGSTALQRSFLRTTSIGESKEYSTGSFSVRTAMWKATLRMLLAHPLSGVGAGAWEVQVPLYQDADTTVETDYHAHNEFLQLLSEYGAVVGGLFIAFLLAYLLRTTQTTWQMQVPDQKEAALRITALTSLLALLIVGNAGFPLHLAACSALLALCLATLAASDARIGPQEAFLARPLPWRASGSRALLTLLVGSTLLALYVTTQAARSEFRLMRAITLANGLLATKKQTGRVDEESKALLLQDMREALPINPHYRQLATAVAGPLAEVGDWTDAVWIWQYVALSRPNIAALWSNLAYGYTLLGRKDEALQAIRQLERLKPDSRALKLIELSRTGHEDQAMQFLADYFQSGDVDYDLVQFGYTLGLQQQNWALAIRALELSQQKWPAQTAECAFRLGEIYAHPAVHDAAKALEAFRIGLEATAEAQKDNYRSRVPDPYRTEL